NGHFRFGGEVKEGERNSDVVVQVSSCCHGPEFSGETGVNQFFGGCLSITSGESYNRNSTIAAVESGQFLEALQDIRYQNEPGIRNFCSFINDCKGGSCLE